MGFASWQDNTDGEAVIEWFAEVVAVYAPGDCSNANDKNPAVKVRVVVSAWYYIRLVTLLPCNIHTVDFLFSHLYFDHSRQAGARVGKKHLKLLLKAVENGCVRGAASTDAKVCERTQELRVNMKCS